MDHLPHTFLIRDKDVVEDLLHMYNPLFDHPWVGSLPSNDLGLHSQIPPNGQELLSPVLVTAVGNTARGVTLTGVGGTELLQLSRRDPHSLLESVIDVALLEL